VSKDETAANTAQRAAGKMIAGMIGACVIRNVMPFVIVANSPCDYRARCYNSASFTASVLKVNRESCLKATASTGDKSNY